MVLTNVAIYLCKTIVTDGIHAHTHIMIIVGTFAYFPGARLETHKTHRQYIPLVYMWCWHPLKSNLGHGTIGGTLGYFWPFLPVPYFVTYSHTNRIRMHGSMHTHSNNIYLLCHLAHTYNVV
jgi:hypothetical protein